MSIYGPVDLWTDGPESFHVDGGENVPSGVTLVQAGSAGRVEVREGSANVLVDGLTVTDIAVVTGRLSGRDSVGVDYTITPGASLPDAGSHYYVKLVCIRSDGLIETLEQRLRVHA
jgi:hypothetical protein